MHSQLPYGRQTIDDDDIAAVVATLGSDLLTYGPQGEAFEREFAAYVGAKHAVAVCNATAALHLAMLVTGIKRDDRVMTSPNTFLASANCAAFVGATPDFVDIDPVSYNLDPSALEAGWKPDTKAVVTVAYAGQPANLPAVARIARKRGAVVIDDACHGPGGGFVHADKVWKLGGHPWADITIFSFHPVKNMTTGEGGILATDNDEYARRARLLRTHGMQRDPSRFLGFGTDDDTSVTKPGPWVYEMQELGYNYRITDIQCALGRSQLKKLDRFIRRRREIVSRYNEAFADLPWLTVPGVRNPADRNHISWHLYTVQIDFTEVRKTRSRVMAELLQKGVGTQVLYIPVHMQPWYRQTYGYGRGKCPIAEAFYACALSLPLYPALSDSDVSRVIESVRNLV